MGAHISDANCTVDSLLGLAYCPLFVLGLLVNAAALCAFIQQESWTDTHIYMFNLVIADSSLIICLPFRIYHSFFCLDKTHWCTFFISTHFINMYASIMTSMAISIHRYLVVSFPLQVRSWRKKKETAFAVCLLIWGSLVTTAIVYREENYPHKLWTCFERCKDQPLRLNFIVILLLLGFIAPLLTVVFCSSRIICILLKTEGGASSPLQRNIVGIVTANMLVFIGCYTPIHVGFLVNYFYNAPANWQFIRLPVHEYLRVSEWIASSNCCFDSVGYYFLLKKVYP
ncbi:G-protein coupled receptor 35 [Dunckerocampus dactyliophorus]|uniref:G-protein coupled receptor 35 n=1 Tax=Dunckerocampus dactyliophorus TaxID=161453 RepID=UPI002405EEB1|nr:G-protein coupled receptor 35 [Dunckerocampus dactyliophorus]